MKSCTPLWREAHFQVKMYKTHQGRTTVGSWHVEKCTPLWREADFQVKMLKTPNARTTFEGSEVVLRGRRMGFCTLPKVSKTWGFCSISKNDGRCRTFEEDLERCMSRGRRSTRNMFIRDVRRSGRWFPERGCILEHAVFKFAKMILRDGCSTSYDLASLFRGRRNTLDRWSGKIAETHWHEAVSSALNFPFLKEVLQNCFILMLSTWTIEEVSQNSFVSDVVKFKSWGNLAELLRSWCCQSSKIEEVSQNCFACR